MSSHSRASASVDRPAARVSMAETRWLDAVEYSIRPPGSATKGAASAARTQFRLLTHAP